MNKFNLFLLFSLFYNIQSVPLKYKPHIKKNSSKNYFNKENTFQNNLVKLDYMDEKQSDHVMHFKGSSGSVKCSVCEILISAIKLVLKYKLPEDKFLKYGVKICSKIYVEEVCKGAVKMFKTELLEVLSVSTLASSEVCQVLTTHNCSGHEIKAIKWVLNVPAFNSCEGSVESDGKTIVRNLVSMGDISKSFDLEIKKSWGGKDDIFRDKDNFTHKYTIDDFAFGGSNKKIKNNKTEDKIKVTNNIFINFKKNLTYYNTKNIKKEEPIKAYRILHLSDIHLDLHYTPFSNALCPEPLCCRHGKPIEPEARAGYWGDYRHCDLPLWTLEDTLQKLSKQHYDHIVWTGDTISHNIWQQDRKEQVQVLNLIMNLFDRFFPNTPVYSALGNHESVPVNSFPTPSTNESVAWLYETVYKLWSPWLPSDARETVLKAGFYSALLPSTNLRVISLNMNFCNNLNGWLLLNATDPYDQLQWLIKILLQAEASSEKVHVIGHIPPGVPECLKWWSFNYNNIVRRFHKTIVGQFFGHRHFDSFEIFYEDDQPEEVISRAISVAYLSPSLTTFTDNNPAYREYDVDTSNWTVIDYRTYVMDLESSNKNHHTNWTLEYSAKDTYGMTDMTPQSFERLVRRMITDENLFNQYFRYYYKSHPGERKCDDECKWMMLCSLLSSQSYDISHCKRLLNVKYARSEKDWKTNVIAGLNAEVLQEKYLEWASEHNVC